MRKNRTEHFGDSRYGVARFTTLEEVVKNIKRLNNSQELDFNITIQALTAGNKDLGAIDEVLFGDDEDEISFKNFGK